MKNTLYKLLILIAGFLFAYGCNKKNQPSEIIIVDKEFNILPFEKLNETGGDFQLRLATIAPDICGGIRIGYEKFVNASQISVTISELKYPSLCNGFTEPAKDTISFGKLQNGTYKFNINLGKSVTNSGTLRVNDAYYQINMTKENGIRLQNSQLLRIPKGTIWGFIGYDKDNEVKSADFINNLLKISTPLDVSEGYYGYFTNLENEIDIHDSFNSSKNTIKKIIYNLTGSQKDLQDMISKAKSNGLDVKIYTFDGKVFH